MGKNELDTAFKLVNLLVTPSGVKQDREKSWFISILKSKNQEYCQAVEGAIALEGDAGFDYVRCCVNALVNLKLELVNILQEGDIKLKGPSLDPDVLSISQQKNVSSLLEMIVVLGILPNLVPGVGLPLEKRSDFLQEIIKDIPQRKILDKYKQLVYSVESLLDIAKHRSFTTLVMTKHISDLLTALIQMSYAPLMKPVNSDDNAAATVTCPTAPAAADILLEKEQFVMTSDLHDRLTGDQKRYRTQLQRIIERNYQPTIVRSLIVLQSCGAAKSSSSVTVKRLTAPKWFSRQVSQLLTARLVAEGGVANVVRGVLDLSGDTADSMDWKKVGLVASVLGNPPEGDYASTEKYYQCVCPQIIELLDHEDKVYQMIACAAVKAVCERSLILSRRYLLDVIMMPLIALAEDEVADVTATTGNGATVSEPELDHCIKTLFKVFVIGTDPCLMFLANIERVVLVLLEMHATIAYSVSHLRDPLKQILHRYLKHIDTGTALVVLRAFAMSEVPEQRKGRMCQLNKDMMFACGEEGGVRVVTKVANSQSFYLSDDEKSIVVQDLMDELKVKKLTVDFYMSLMADLTDIIVVECEPHPDLPDPQEGQSMEEQLLELEKHMDTMMHRMRKNLMVIRLLGLFSEDKSLQDDLLKESNRMIEFIGATLKRGALTAGSNVEEQSPGVMAVQSLNMALTILSLHLTQGDVSTDDWRKMQDFLSDLQVLSCHPDTRVSKIAGQLYQLVAAHGEIILQTDNIKQKTRTIHEETERMRAKSDQLKSLQKESENQQMDERKRQLQAKADQLRQAKEERRRANNKCLQDEEKEIKIVEDKTGLTPLGSALYDLGDPLLPVRGHGLIELARLVEQKDAETVEQMSRVWQVFVDSLEDEDTYIYLSAVQGLVNCARYRPDEVLDRLTTEFTQVYQRRDNLGERAAETRTKIGEALVRATNELGELTPKYKALLLNALFSAAVDPDATVRASALSNLGEVCRNLRFSLSGVAGELMLHLESASRDIAVEVRRAAAMVLTMVLEGLGRDVFEVLQSSLRDIHRSLRLRLGVETDETTLVHINLALDQIDKIVRELFTPNLTQSQPFLINPQPN